jgi:hypothetical protein
MYWAGNDMFFPGTVTAFDKASMAHRAGPRTPSPFDLLLSLHHSCDVVRHEVGRGVSSSNFNTSLSGRWLCLELA